MCLNRIHYVGLLSAGLLLVLLLCAGPVQADQAVSLQRGAVIDLMEHGRLFQAGDEVAPASADALPAWLSQRQPVSGVNLLGGAYWLYTELHNESDLTSWILNPNGTLIDQVDVRVFYSDGRHHRFVSGYRAEHDYLMHYGKPIHLPGGDGVKVLVRFESPYFASIPSFEVETEPDYQSLVVIENVIVLAAFGALLTLALYNLFIFAITRDRTFFYYSAYLIAYFLGWAFTFHVPAELFGWHNLHVHYIPFFLLPVLNTLFYMEFLQLRKHFPRLAAFSRINLWLPLVLLPSCFFALSYAHMLATLVITYWLIVALISGIASLRSGYRPARFFVLAFIALLVPGAIILPANIGLIPDLVKNAELLTLLGGTLDAILLAFALADKIRILSQEKDEALRRVKQMLAVARTDHLTGIANRHAFDQMLRQSFRQPEKADDPMQAMLLLIDLDGLKGVNDRHGHARGDELLRRFARDLATLEGNGISVYRLGGDEFTVLAHRRDEEEMRAAMSRFDTNLRESDFDNVGVSFGLAYASECDYPDDMLMRADRRMYEFKTSRRRARAEDGLYPLHRAETP